MKVEKLIVKREKTLKIRNIRLIYCLKLKYNATRRKIRKKTQNLTQMVLKITQFIIGSRLFILGLEKQKSKVQASNSFYSLNENLISNTPCMQK